MNPNTQPDKEGEQPEKLFVEDLQKQVRDHIRADKLFDWHEAMTGEEMIYLEQLMLTFAPMFSPGSIGFEKTVRPYLPAASGGEDKQDEPELWDNFLQGIRENMILGNSNFEVYEIYKSKYNLTLKP